MRLSGRGRVGAFGLGDVLGDTPEELRRGFCHGALGFSSEISLGQDGVCVG